jgi:hypothetical protein
MFHGNSEKTNSVAEKLPAWDTQGIEAVSFFAEGKKDTSGKPGPCAIGARMRPKEDNKIYRFILRFPDKPAMGKF